MGSQTSASDACVWDPEQRVSHGGPVRSSQLPRSILEERLALVSGAFSDSITLDQLGARPVVFIES